MNATTMRKVRKLFLPVLLISALILCVIPVYAATTDNTDSTNSNVVTQDDGTVRAKTDQEKKQEKQTSINVSLPTSFQGRSVYLKNVNGTTIKRATIDAMGNFDLNDINPGSYYITITKETPQTVKAQKKGYPMSYIVMAGILSAIFAGALMWTAGVQKTKRRFAYLREFEYDISLDGEPSDDMLMFDEQEPEEQTEDTSKQKKHKNKKKSKKAESTNHLKRRRLK